MKTATIVLPSGYATAEEFAKDCGFELPAVPALGTPVAWQCIDERREFRYIKGIVSVDKETVEAWKDVGIAFVGLGRIDVPAQGQPGKSVVEALQKLQDAAGTVGTWLNHWDVPFASEDEWIGDRKLFFDAINGAAEALTAAAVGVPAEGATDSLQAEIGMLREKLSDALAGGLPHKSDCAVYNAPAEEPGPCDCGVGAAFDDGAYDLARKLREHNGWERIVSDTDAVNLIKALVASSRHSPAASASVICRGCGSTRTNEQLAAMKASNPEIVSCCPERDALDIAGWAARAAMLEDQLRRHSQPESVDLTNHHNALLCPYCNPKGLKLEEPRG